MALWNHDEDIAPALMAELKRGESCNVKKALKLVQAIRGKPRPLLLSEAARQGQIKVVAALLDKGADLEERNNKGSTPLMHAACYGHFNVALLLLEKGADIGARAKYRETARYWAANKGHTEIAQMLAVIEEEKNSINATAAPEEWLRPSPGRVAHVEFLPDLQVSLTDIFDFAARERLVLTTDLKTGMKTPSAPVSFDAVNKAVLEKALAEFLRLGGVADERSVFRKKLDKPKIGGDGGLR